MENNLPYVEMRNGTYYVRGLKVQLSQIISQWQIGHLPETIALNFSFLTMAQVYGSIAYYLESQEELDRHFEDVWAEEDAIVAEHHAKYGDRYAELRRRFDAIKSREASSAS